LLAGRQKIFQSNHHYPEKELRLSSKKVNEELSSHMLLPFNINDEESLSP
jgi:hypothetical protein